MTLLKQLASLKFSSSFVSFKEKLLASILTLVIIPASYALDELPNQGSSSSSNKHLNTKIKVFEQFVSFRRAYKKMNLYVSFRRTTASEKAGYVEGFVLIVAVIPQEEISLWSEGMESIAMPELSWLYKRNGRIDYSHITKWYRRNTVVVGIDRVNSIIVYYDSALAVKSKK